MPNIGRIIQDAFCNGFADRDYDMDGAVIIAEGESWIVCKKTNGRNIFLDFQIFNRIRDEKGKLTGEIVNIRTQEDMQQLIDKWCI